MKKIALVLVCLLALSGCTKPDPSKPFGMYLNNSTYRPNLGAAEAYFLTRDVGYSYQKEVWVVFPFTQKYLNSMQKEKSGLVLSFDPSKIKTGEIISIQAGSKAMMDCFVEFNPLSGSMAAKGMILSYSSSFGTGSVQVQFDSIDSEIGGRVKGKIISAVLYGSYENMDDPIKRTPKEELKMDVYNFSFDVELKQSILN